MASYVDDVCELLRSDARGSLLVQTVARVILTAQLLRSQALDAVADKDTESIEIRECALRARMNIVVRALYALKQNERWMSRAAFAGRFRSLRDLSAHVIDEVAQIHQRWLEQRAPRQSLDVPSLRTLAYAALDDAEIAFERLGRDSDLEHFMRVGASSACEAIATACREMAITVGVALRGSSEEGTALGPGDSADRSAS